MKHLLIIPALITLTACEEVVRRDTSIATFDFPHGTDIPTARSFAEAQGYTACGQQMVGPNLLVKCWEEVK